MEHLYFGLCGIEILNHSQSGIRSGLLPEVYELKRNVGVAKCRTRELAVHAVTISLLLEYLVTGRLKLRSGNQLLI